MRVNADFMGFFARRLAVGALVLLSVFFTASSFTTDPGHDLRARETNLMIRQIGHRLLLHAGDSTSRVMPVTEMHDGTFLLSFAHDFTFNHDSLIALSQRLLPEKQFPSGYTVTVHDCAKGNIVYGFQVNNPAPDILACNGRSQPSGCYTIEFVFPDFYENVKPTKADIAQVIKSDNQEEKFEETRTTTAGNQLIQPKPQNTNTRVEESKATTSDFPFMHVIYGGILLLVGVTFLIGYLGKKLNPAPGKIDNQATSEEPAEGMPLLGKFLFNVKDQRLLLESEVVSLTNKECKVLKLLHKNFGELIPRETLMQEVWINEGVITGRSLDMFVSKLRKKLSHDPDLRITNVHGKGYMLEVLERQAV